MNLSTKFFLVLLQVAIGWHFLYEGLWKIQEGKTWTSKGYLQGAAGPIAPALRWSAGDPTVTRDGAAFTVEQPTIEVEAYFKVKPIDPNLAPSDRRLHQHLPVLLEAEWDAYFQNFLTHYELTAVAADTKGLAAKAGPLPDEKTVPPEFIALLGAAPQAGPLAGIPWAPVVITWVPNAWRYEVPQDVTPAFQRALAERRFEDLKADTVTWLLSGTKKVKRPNFSGPAAEASVSIPQRLQEYLAADKKARDLEASQTAKFGPKATPELKKAKDEASALRSEVLADLRDQTNRMKLGLRDVLTADQKRMAIAPDASKETAAWPYLKRVDLAVRWGLAAIGAGLVLGLFTRLASLSGTLLLLTFYLAAPAFPWLPEAPASEGHYLFINKNVIEMLALLAIACSHPGKRYGLDMLLCSIFGLFRGKRRETKAARRAIPVVPVPAPAEHAEELTTEPSIRSDPTHAS